MKAAASSWITAGFAFWVQVVHVFRDLYQSGTSSAPFSEAGNAPPFQLLADDAVGGFFAIDGGGLSLEQGKVCYFAPDTLDWEWMEMRYSDFSVGASAATRVRDRRQARSAQLKTPVPGAPWRRRSGWRQRNASHRHRPRHHA